MKLETAPYLLAILLTAYCSSLSVSEAQPQPGSTTYYTTTISKVKNTTKYAPYQPPPVHDVGLNRRQSFNVLQGTAEQIDEAQAQTIDITSYPGLDSRATSLVGQSQEIIDTKTISISDNIFRNWIQQTHSKFSGKVFAKNAVLVVKGRWDHAEHALAQCGIPFTLVGTNELPSKLAGAQVVIANCPGLVSLETLPQLREFVRKGGYFLTTDWALDGCLAPTFPEYVKWDGAYSNKEIVNGVRVAEADPILSGTVSSGPWKLDDKSQLVRPSVNPINVLVRSKQLSAEDPSGLGILALSFPFGKGKVAHLVGHFDNNTNLASNSALQDPSPRLIVSLRQMIAINFVIERLEQP